jgi:outer membrane protein insertion porin family
MVFIVLIVFFLSAPYSELLGQDLYVKKISIEGNRHTKEYIIKREISTREGQFFTESQLNEDKNRLLNLGLFSEVEISSALETDSIVVNIKVKERFALIPFPVVNYTELDGWAYGGGLLHRNFTGRNRTACGFVLLGNSAQYYLSLYDPWIAGERVSFQCEFARLMRDHPYEDFQQTDTYIWSEIGKRWDYDKWGRMKIGFRRVDSDESGITLTDDYSDIIPYSLITLIYDSRDIWANPKSGWRADFKIGQYGIPTQKPDYRYFYLGSAHYFPLIWGRTLALMCAFAERNGFIPAYESFYFGGAYSVRGYEYNYDSGSRILLSGVEYRWNLLKSRPILPKMDFGLGGALFWDGGTVWDAGDDFDALKWHNGFGGGLRFFVPILEVIRLDLAWNPDSRYRLEIAAGMKF